MGKPQHTGTRKLALDALERIDPGGAYANLVLPSMLNRSELSPRDRGFVTGLVYGTTRMRRACDFLVDRYLSHPPPSRVRNALRLGAYQLAYAGVSPHAAVSETVAVSPTRMRGMVNAVLRRVAKGLGANAKGVEWPDEATRLSVPDWMWDRLVNDLGETDTRAALESMNQPAEVHERPDSYVQDPASQHVAEAVGAEAGDRVLDVCAAPGGKTTALASGGAWIASADSRPSRVGLIRANIDKLGLHDGVALTAADGTQPPWRRGSFDRVLVDAPCSGLGTLRRRADLRWRAEEASVARLAELQLRLLEASSGLLRPGGTLVYSVCTLTAAESTGVDEAIAASRPELVPVDPPDDAWAKWGRGALLLPQTAGTDGMCMFRYEKSG